MGINFGERNFLRINQILVNVKEMRIQFWFGRAKRREFKNNNWSINWLMDWLIPKIAAEWTADSSVDKQALLGCVLTLYALLPLKIYKKLLANFPYQLTSSLLFIISISVSFYPLLSPLFPSPPFTLLILPLLPPPPHTHT